MGETFSDLNRSRETDLKQHIRDVQAAAALGLKVSTLRKWRGLGKGPKWRRFSRAVVYDTRDLQAWVERQPSGGGGR